MITGELKNKVDKIWGIFWTDQLVIVKRKIKKTSKIKLNKKLHSKQAK